MRQFSSRPCHLDNARLSGSQRGSQADPQWRVELPVTSAFATTTRLESFLLLGFLTPECMSVLGLAPSMGGMELNRSGSCLGRVLRGGRHVRKLSHVVITVLSVNSLHLDHCTAVSAITIPISLTWKVRYKGSVTCPRLTSAHSRGKNRDQTV